MLPVLYVYSESSKFREACEGYSFYIQHIFFSDQKLLKLCFAMVIVPAILINY